MGWTFPYTTKSKESLVDHLLRANTTERFKPVAHRVVGKNLWMVVEMSNIDGDDAWRNGTKIISLYMMERHGGNDRRMADCWGYKDMDETSGPYEHDCPEAFLELATDYAERGYAAEWRTRVRAFHVRRRALSALEPVPGQVVTLGGADYTIEAPYKRGYWTVIRKSDGGRFKAKVSDIREGLYQEPAAPASTPATETPVEQSELFA